MPYVNVWVDIPESEIKELDEDDLVKEMERRGFTVFKKAAEGYERIEHLIDCGLITHAREEALQLVESALNRPRALTCN